MIGRYIRIENTKFTKKIPFTSLTTFLQIHIIKYLSIYLIWSLILKKRKVAKTDQMMADISYSERLKSFDDRQTNEELLSRLKILPKLFVESVDIVRFIILFRSFVPVIIWKRSIDTVKNMIQLVSKTLFFFNLCLVGGGRKVVAHFYTGSSAANFDFCDLRPEWQFFLDTILHDPTKNKISIFSAKSWFLASSRR